MNCVSCDICVYHLWFVCVFFPGVFLSSRVTGACPVTTELIMRVNVRTTTTTTTYFTPKKSFIHTLFFIKYIYIRHIKVFVLLRYQWGISSFDHLPKVSQ